MSEGLSFIVLRAPTSEHSTHVTTIAPLNQQSLISQLRLHLVPERYWSVGYHHDTEAGASYHFTPIPTERTSLKEPT